MEAKNKESERSSWTTITSTYCASAHSSCHEQIYFMLGTLRSRGTINILSSVTTHPPYHSDTKKVQAVLHDSNPVLRPPFHHNLQVSTSTVSPRAALIQKEPHHKNDRSQPTKTRALNPSASAMRKEAEDWIACDGGTCPCRVVISGTASV